MKKSVSSIIRIQAIFLAVCFISAPVFAAELSYDKYAAVYEGKPESKTKRVLLNLLSYPAELIRWPIDKNLYYTEKYSLDKKARWLYDKAQSHGFTFSLHDFKGGGVDIDVLRVVNLKEDFPDAFVDTWIDYVDDVRFTVGSEIGAERVFDTGIRTSGYFQYDTRPQEHFFGVGPATSPGDGTVFKMETTQFRGNLGYSPDPTFSIDSFVEYRNVNIYDGKDGGRGQRGEHKTFQTTLPGYSGDSIFSLGLEMVHDTRNQKENSTSGGKRRLGLSYNEGLNSSEARYMKYEADVSQYFRLGSDRRVFVARLYGEHNDSLNGGQVPFHQMARLGGHGVSNRMSQTLRAFEYNRFFDDSALLMNLEYRYTVWEYREFKLDTILFFEEGQVFDEFSKLQFSDFRESYGLGFRLSLANIVLVSLEMAHGDEGTNFYFKTHAPF